MEAAIANTLFFGAPLLLVAVWLLAKGRWRVWAAVFAVYGALLWYYSVAQWGGPGDAAMGRGMVALFAMVTLVLTGFASLIVIMRRLGRRNRDVTGQPDDQV